MAAALMQQARTAIREGRLVEARRLLRQVIREEPHNHAAWLLLARATPDANLSAQYIERAHLLRPDSPLVQRARDDLLAKDEPVSSRRGFAWRPMLLAVGTVLFVGLVVAMFNGGAWEQVVAWQNEAGDRAAAAPLESIPAEQQTVSQSVPDTTDRVLSDSDHSAVPGSVDEPRSPSAIATADRPNELENIHASGEDSRDKGEASFEPVVITDPNQALPSAILAGIETETSAVDDEEAAGTEVGSESTIVYNSELEDIAVDTIADQDEELIAEKQDLARLDREAADAESTAANEPVASDPADGRWIDVNLTTQTLVAYEGETPVMQSLISSGMWQFPTVTGEFRTWMKYESQDMTGYHLGYNYRLDDVPYVMYFFEDYAIHGAYWHNNFGTPMSHGCVNVTPLDAEWLFNWAPIGTVVKVHH